MHTVVIVVHLMLVLALIGVVLVQRSEGGGLGIGGGGGGAGFMSGRGTANLLTRTTAFLAIGFFVTSLVLSWLAGYDRRPASIINPTSQPGAPSAPLSGGGGNILDSLKAREGIAPPAAPAAPSGPQVPQSK